MNKPHLPSSIFHLLLACLLLLVSPLAQATTYTWTKAVNAAGSSDTWSSGTNWTATAPVSASTTTLVFGYSWITNSTAATNTLTNNIANPFQLNVMTLGINLNPNPGSGSSVGLINIAGSPLEFVSNGGTTPQVNLSQNRSAGQVASFDVQTGVILTNNTLFTGNGTANFTISGAISGAGTFTKGGTSTLVLSSGSNSYSGGTTINGGTLSITSAGTLGQNVNTNNVSIAAGASLYLAAVGNTGANQTITLTSTAGSLSTLALGNNSVPAATIAQTDTNGGLIAINAVTGYTGNLSTALTGKNLFLGAIGTSTFTGAAATLAAGNGATYRLGGGGGSISFNTANQITGANSVQIGSTATGGTGTVIFGASQNFSAGTTVSNGSILQITSAGTLGTNVNTNNVTLNAGARMDLAAVGNTGANQTITLTSTAGLLSTLALGNNSVPNATIAQTDTNGGLIAINAITGYTGNLSTALTGKNLFLGAIGTSTFTGAVGTVVAGNGTTYRLGGGGGSISFNTANLITGANAVQIGSTATSGTGTVSFGASQNYTGNTAIASGSTLQITGASQLGTTPGTYNGDFSMAGGTLNYSSSATQTLGGNLTGAGTLTKSGGSTLKLTGTTNTLGAVTVSGGLLTFDGGSSSNTSIALTGGGVSIINGATLSTTSGGAATAYSANGSMTITGGNGVTSTWNLNGGNIGVVASNQNNTQMTIDGAGFVGSARVTNVGQLNWFHDVSNGTINITNGGQMNVNGTISIGSNYYGGTNANMTIGGGTVTSTFTGNNQTFIIGNGERAGPNNNDVIVSNFGVLTNIGAMIVGDMNYNGTPGGIATANQLTVSGTGTASMTNITVGNARQSSGPFNSQANANAILVTGGGTLTTSSGTNSIGFASFNPSIANTNTATVTGTGSTWNASSQNIIVGNAVAGATSNNNVLTVSSSGVLSNVATLTVGSATGTATGNQVVVNGGTITATALTVNTGNTVSVGGSGGLMTVNGALTGAGSATITGGRLTLTGSAVTKSLAVTINGGDFRNNGSSAYTGTLTYTQGTISGTNWGSSLSGLTIGTNQTISPGNSPGTAASVAQTWANGGTYVWEINNTTGTKGGDPGWDWLNLSGGLTQTASSNGFTIKITGLTTSNVPGAVSNWNAATTNTTWIIASAATGITGFNAGGYTLDTSAFTNFNTSTGLWSILQGNGSNGGNTTDVLLRYQSPASGTLTLNTLASRVLAGSTVNVTGSLSNSATAGLSLNISLSSTGTTTVTGITPASGTVAPGATNSSVAGSFTAGSGGTTNSVQLTNTDGSASPTTAVSNTVTNTSVDQRTYTNPGQYDFGRVLLGTALNSGALGITTSGSHATTADATLGTSTSGTINGLSATGGTDSFTGGSGTANRTISGTLSGTAGTLTGTFNFNSVDEFSNTVTNAANVSYTVNGVATRTVDGPSSTSLGTFHAGATVNTPAGAAFTYTYGAGGDGSHANTEDTAIATNSGAADAYGIVLNSNASPINSTTTYTGSFTGTATVANAGGGNTLSLGVTPEFSSSTTVSAAYTIGVYSGQMVWGGGSGTYNVGSNWTDSVAGGAQNAPGLDAGFTGVDTATFNGTGGTVSLNGSSPNLNAITFNNNGNYILAQGSGGAITLSGTPSITVSGTGTGTHEISANVTLAANTTATVNSTSTLTLSGIINGSGQTLTKEGTGTLVVSSSSSATIGTTNVNNGTLVVNGILTGDLTTGPGTVLRGGGSITGSTAISGTIAAGTGNIIDYLATGALTLDGTSTFAYKIDRPGTPAGDLLAVTGALNLNSNSLLTITDGGSGSWVNGDKLTLISYSGAWNGALFTYLGNPLLDGSTISVGGTNWLFDYNDLIGPGSNFNSYLTGPGYVTMTVQAIPEPSRAVLMLIGAAGLLMRRKRKA